MKLSSKSWTPQEKEKIKTLMKNQGLTVKDSDLNAEQFAEILANSVIDDLKNNIKNLKTSQQLKEFIRNKLKIGNSDMLSKSSMDWSYIQALYSIMKIVTPHVAYYILLSVLFRIFSWISGNRKTLF